MPGRVYLIPVPLADTPVSDVLPSYNAGIIRGLKHFIVENTRSARRFLKSVDRTIDIDSLSIVELNGHTDPDTIPSMIAPALQGQDIGIISEAGCPAIADPGADIVALAQSNGLEVMPLVGPSSIIMGLMGSGFNGQSFAFLGYLPIERDKRAAAIKEMERMIISRSQTQIFIETPYRNNKLVAELASSLPRELKLCVASDITGPAQSIMTRPLSYWHNATYDYNKRPTIFLLYK